MLPTIEHPFDDCISHKFIYEGYATVAIYCPNRKTTVYPICIHFINPKLILFF
ncbi:hypothetical protein FEM08_04360 [Flavobacterium gilvum]|nr:hypothetical protein FEM08_04360 [Flavobacterium gilvum]